MSELEVHQPREIVQPLTGELIRGDDIASVAGALVALREHRNLVNEAIAAFTVAAAEESKRLGTRTLTAGSVKVELSPEFEVEWDFECLRKLLDLGLPEERYNELVRAEVTYKVDGRVARQLEGASEEYAKVIRRARVRVPKRQYASVK